MNWLIIITWELNINEVNLLQNNKIVTKSHGKNKKDRECLKNLCGSKMELWRKTTWESSLNKIKTETYKSHNLQPLACPTTEGNSENKIKTETYKSHNLQPSFLPPTTTKYFPTHAIDLVIIDEAHHYSARTRRKSVLLHSKR